MSRPIVLSNGSMLVGINRYGLVHDFYYPYVGLENHDTARNLRHRVGVWIDGQFSWLDDDSWKISWQYEDKTLVGRIVAEHDGLKIKLTLNDAVDHDHDVFLRQISVENQAPNDRHIRLMLHQVYQISNSLSGDTAQYLPGMPAILHYKGNRNFIIRARLESGEPFDQFSVGLTGIEGKEGTYVDAEDGELAGNPVEHGSVDSVVRCCLDVAAGQSATVDYWVAAGLTREGALVESELVARESLASRIESTRKHWREWLQPSEGVAAQMPDDQARRFQQSLLLIKAHIDRRGGVLASSDTQMLNYARDAYAYCWPRDGVYALWPLVRLGYRTEIVNFFEFCRLGLQKGGYLMHKYQPDAAVGSSWHPYLSEGHPEPPIQEDETAAVVLLMREYYRAQDDEEVVERYFNTLIRPMANFMSRFVDSNTGLPHPSYDLWEENFGTFSYTVMITQAALRAAAELADAIGASEEAVKWQLAAEDMGKAARKQLLNQETGYFFKWVKRGNQQANPTVDASGFYAAWMYGSHQPDEETMVQALSTLLKTFKQEEKFSGIPRYLNDMYHSGDPKALGNPWFITSLWLAQYYIQTGDMDKAAEIVAWTEAAMLPTGALSEQLNGKTGESLSVAPLTWSQAEYVSTLLDYYAAKSHRTTERVRHANWTGHKAESATTGSQGPRIIPVIQA